MKSAFMVYYTFEGNTGYAAELIQSALFQEDPALHEMSTDISAYDNIIIAFPIWAGTYPPAIGSFIKRCPIKGKNIFLIACSGSGRSEKAFDNIKKKLSGNTFCGELSLVEPLKYREKSQRQIDEFVKKIESAMAD